MLFSVIPNGFRYSYIVPLSKSNDCFSKSWTCNDFRGIAISPILSKVSEHCVLNKLGSFLKTADNQFGCKKGIGCNYAVRAARSAVENIVNGGNTANICAIDLSKAFDKVNHFTLFSQLMWGATYLGSDIDSDRYTPTQRYTDAWASLAPLWLNLTKSGVSKDSVSPPSSEYTPLLCSR